VAAEIIIEQDIVGLVANHGGGGGLAFLVKDQPFEHGNG